MLAKVREAAELGELDALIEQQAQFGRRVTQKNERTEERVWIKHVLRLTLCKLRVRKLLNCNSRTSVEKTCKVVGELHTCYTWTMRW